MSTPSFADLCSAMDAAGVEVAVDLDGDGHVLRLRDFHRLRSLELPVTRGFDAETVILCCSLALCAGTDGSAGDGPRLARDWPELVALARDASDLGVSDDGRPRRLS